MIKINALNDEALVTTNETNHPSTATKEALEEEAFAVYRKALEHIQHGRTKEAQDALYQLLETNFVQESCERSHGVSELPLSPGLTLKYLAYKNLASIANDSGNYKSAMEAYLEAVHIDNTDVNVWFKMGLIGMHIENFPLARLCFYEGLKCNPTHWLCLDRIITLTYALNDYSSCLYYIAKALQKSFSYLKGLAIRDQIYRDHPMLRLNSDTLFKECDARVYSFKYDKEKAQKVISEALDIRNRKCQLSLPKPLPELNLRKPFEEFTWKSLGDQLNTLYDYIKNSDPTISMGCRVILSSSPEVNTSKEKFPKEPTSDSSSEGSSSESPDPVETETVEKTEGCLLMEVDDDLAIASENEKQETGSIVLPNLRVGGVKTSLTIDIPVDKGAKEQMQTTGPKPRAKRKRMLFDPALDSSWKRRSARVRNTGGKKTEDSTNYRELLSKFLPSSLLSESHEDEQDDLEDPMTLQIDIPGFDHTYGQSVPCRHEERQQFPEGVEYLVASEVLEVKEFLDRYSKNGGIIDLFRHYLFHLSLKSHLVWPNGLSEIYMCAFDRWRKHITQPSLFSKGAPPNIIKQNGWITLVYQELKVDKWQNKLRLSSVSPSLGNARSGTTTFGLDILGEVFFGDQEFLMYLMVRKDLFNEQWNEYMLRVLWQKSKFHILEGDIVSALRCIDKMASLFDHDKENDRIFLVNCHSYNVIALANVKEKLESLQRCQSLEEIHRLYEQMEYQRVVDLLIPTFNRPQSRVKSLEDGNVPERHYQLLLLQDSLWKLEVYNKYLFWGETAFNESLQQYLASASSTTTRDWANTMTQLLNGLDTCLCRDEELLSDLTRGKLIRLTNNLIRVISLQMNSSEFNSETNVTTLAPWMILYRMIHHEEKKILYLASKSSLKGGPEKPTMSQAHLESGFKESELSDSSISNEEEDTGQGDLSKAMPSSLMLLFTAHDYLGNKSWCTATEGAFLYLIVEVMMAEIQGGVSAHLEDFKMAIEQCFYCLHSHPNKRPKAKRLVDHNCPTVSLAWGERAKQLFLYFQPEVQPEFDSYKTSTVSADLENLFRRITLLIPPEEDPTNATESVVAYIEGGTSQCPISPGTKVAPSLVVKEIYYLLGDYYFKNKEFGKACKFFILDIVVTPNRLDSWAGMALARSSQLEQRLTSGELKNDTTVYRKSCSALRSFKRALEIDAKRITLWIEYGSMAYMLHAYASRQLKQQSQLNLPDDILELLRNKREEMIATAEHCFHSANQCYQDSTEPAEVWLHHYMLGKIAEKRLEHPRIYLEHYQLAAEHLYLELAKYPKKILYHNPPNFSIEALECYYRSHTSILKYLQLRELSQPQSEELAELYSYVKTLEDNPFANFQEMQEPEAAMILVEENIPAKKLVRKRKSTPGGDHDYVERRNSLPLVSRKRSSEQEANQVALESSSESSDSAAVKDVLNLLVTVVSERSDSTQIDNHLMLPVIILGDQKLRKTVSEASMPCPKLSCEVISKEQVEEPVHTKKEKPSEKNTKSSKELSATKKGEGISITFNELVDKCLAAVLECQQRFAQHYKSLYRLAHYYCYSNFGKNLQKSREILLGGLGPFPSLFGERKNTNFFNGIWRIPVDEIDRPGSFASHMFRSLVLLIDVLRQLEDFNMLTHLTIQLSRTPDPGKKYLRDTDRLHLARESFCLCLSILREQMNALLLEEPPPDEIRLIACLLDIYRTWQSYQKTSVFPDEANDLLEEAYTLYKLGEVDSSPPVLDQSIRFCQSALSQGYKSRTNLQPLVSVKENRSGASSSSHQMLVVPPPYAILEGIGGKSIPTPQTKTPVASTSQSSSQLVALPITRPATQLDLTSDHSGNNEFLKWYCQWIMTNTAFPKDPLM